MSDAYIGEVRMWAGTFAPVNWHFCDGSLLNIAQYDPLFNLIGITYGGDGVNVFALPDLRGRVPIHTRQGSGLQPYSIGAQGGSETVTLTAQQLPSHGHGFAASGSGGQSAPSNSTYLGSPGSALTVYVTGTPASAMANASIGSTGGGQPHANVMPFLAVNFIICLIGVYPIQS